MVRESSECPLIAGDSLRSAHCAKGSAAGVRSGEGEPELKGILCQSTRLQYLISRRGRFVMAPGSLKRIKELSRTVVRESSAKGSSFERL